MGDRSRDARYLREKARRFRVLAAAYDPEISARLRDLAADLEALASDLENRADKTGKPPP